MNLTAIAMRYRTVTYFATALLVVGGIVSFFGLGQLEDPEFTIKSAVIATPYAGASAVEVEREVTDRIELAVQELAELDYVESTSQAGLSTVKVFIKDEFWADRLPQVWDLMRRKISDVQADLPPGAGPSIVNDDFGAVFGFQLAVVSDGFSYAELEDYAEALRRELSLVDGVARVDLWGTQRRAIYIDLSRTQIGETGVGAEAIAATLQVQNEVVDAGHLDLGARRLRIAPTGTFVTAQDIGDLVLRTAPAQTGTSVDTSLLRISDVGEVREGYVDPPRQMMRHNGLPSIGISISNESGVNIVDVGAALDQRLAQLQADLPIGIEIFRVHWQSDVVSEAVDGFLISFAQAVAIVIVVLALFMGWRMGLIIGMALVFTILATFILMSLMDINLQRISLGALVVALGMMVDNAIVVADGFVARRQKGIAADQAAIESASVPAWPLLGATVVAVMAFYPIYVSPASVGEYCRTLFIVIAMSLLASWLVSMTLTPLNCIDFLKAPRADADADPYGGRLFGAYRGLLVAAMKHRGITAIVIVALVGAAIVGFGSVRQLFFPESAMTKFMVDVWAPEGTRIQALADNLRAAEAELLADGRVDSVTTFIGAGPPRFYLPVEPEPPNPAYAQLIVNVPTAEVIDGLISDLDQWMPGAMPDALVVPRRFGVGPSNTWKVEARLIGRSDTQPEHLRAIAAEVVSLIEAEPMAAYARHDWRQRVRTVVPHFDQDRARWAGVSRGDLANATKRQFDGLPVGVYRDGDDLVPIMVRNVEEERRNVDAIADLLIQPSGQTSSVVLSEVADHLATTWEDPVIHRRDRRRVISVQSNPIGGVTAPQLHVAIAGPVADLDLPPGFTLEWGGDHESSAEANASLAPGLPAALAVMAMIIVTLFNAFRPPLVILLTIPVALVGITVGLLSTNVAFGFVALLGAMSLAGMMIKNAIVLLDEIAIERAEGRPVHDAVVRSSLSRLRPVMLAAATTVLGVIPLLPDVFWVAMAVTIMGGLGVGSILTMIAVPVIYAFLYDVPRTPKAEAA